MPRCVRGDRVVTKFFARPLRSDFLHRRGLNRLSAFLFLVLMLPVFGYSQESATGNTSTTGTIQGTVKYFGDPKHPWRLGRYYIRNAKSGELAEAVVAISARGLKTPPEKREPVTVEIDQKNFQFTPETTAIRVGDHVRFLNSDDHTHNVKTSHPDFSFNVAMPVGSKHTETFKMATGIGQPYRIDCVFHSAMQSWIFVFDHPWFQVTEVDGRFLMKDVPVGEYRLDVVHPAGGLRHRQTIRVVAGEVSEIEIRMKPKAVEP
jgi:plastocyanin